MTERRPRGACVDDPRPSPEASRHPTPSAAPSEPSDTAGPPPLLSVIAVVVGIVMAAIAGGT
jgi:hypothetical protein